MSDSSPSPSLDDLIAFVGAEVTRQYQRSGQRVNGAALAEAIRARFPDLSYAAVGVERLADVVRAAEERGLLVRHRDVRHLEVSPAGAGLAAPSTPPHEGPTGRGDGSVPPDIWQALLFFHPGQTRFFDRETGNVVGVPESESGVYAGNPRYAELRTIPADIQKGWMRQFVAEHPAAAVAAGAIDSDRWYSEFWEHLRAARPDLATAWSSCRARQVIQYVKRWAAENRVPLTYVLSPRPPAATRRAAGGIPAASHPTVQQGRDDEALRAAVLDALSDMSLDELLTLSLPLRHLVRHFRPR
jgi:hypothetical protein